MSRLETRTSNPGKSIWLNLSEDTFRRHLVDLEHRTNAVPIAPQIFALEHHNGLHGRLLPLQLEQQLAADFSFLAAIDEGAQSVAAVCLEEHVQPAGLTLRFAALDLSLDNGVKTALQHIADCLAQRACGYLDLSQVEALFEQIVKLHFRRLLARLRSNKWEKPKYLSRQHKKPLWQDFANLVHRVQFLYTKKEAATRRSVEAHLQSLVSAYHCFEALQAGSQREFGFLKDLIKASYRFCKVADVAEFARRLENSVGLTATAKVASAIKCLRQIEKIAAYWRIANSLLNASGDYPNLFGRKLRLAFLTPYTSVPTTVGYEAWATTCHVHAEVQLAVYYDILYQSSRQSEKNEGMLEPDFHRPRVIGTSKWLCYLCYLFLRCHGCFVPANTHGRLYDQWTVPDLNEYGDELITRYRNILCAIDEEIVKETDNTGTLGTKESDLVRWRAEPMTSRQDLLSTDNLARPHTA